MTDQQHSTSATNLTLSALGAIGAGIGGLGFLTFVGGAISLARFRGAGLSGTAGVSVVPKQELLTLGCDQLLLPMVIALTLSVLLYFVYVRIDLSRRIAVAIPLGIWVVGEVYYLVRVGFPPPRGIAIHFAAATLVGLVGALLAGAIAESSVGARRTTDRLEKPRFLPLGATVFVTAVIVVVLTNFGRSLAFPVVRAAAVVQEGQATGTWGFYVGQTGDRVYIGLSPQKPGNPKQGIHSRGRLIGLPKSKVTHLSIGALQPLPRARRTGPKLLQELLLMRSSGRQ